MVSERMEKVGKVILFQRIKELELCSNVLWKEFVGDELGYFIEEISIKE